MLLNICRFLPMRLSTRGLTAKIKWYSTSTNSFQVIYNENGDPNKVLESKTTTLPPLRSNEVLVRMMAAPINPADINMIQGVYPVRPQLPAIAGNEGVGEVINVGDAVKDFLEGDWVIPDQSGWGTWRTFAVESADAVMKVPNDVPKLNVATLGVNACTAYRMLTDFEDLQQGDVVIQNGANSGVGQSVIQIAKSLQLVTVNIIRNRPDLDELSNALKAQGADHVVTDEFVRSGEMKVFMKSLPKPKLALNCVSGRPSAELLKNLAHGGTMVTYGGMSKQPMMVPAGPLIFSDVRLRGFWMTRWNQDRSKEERKQMWDTLCGMVRSNAIQLPLYETVPIENYKEAVARSMEPYVSRKQILVMDGSV